MMAPPLCELWAALGCPTRNLVLWRVMLANLDDPKSVGPGMAVALLTTLYGALIAQIIALPIADKLSLIAQNEKRLRLLVMDGLAGIQAGNNPRAIVAQLQAYVDPSP